MWKMKMTWIQRILNKAKWDEQGIPISTTSVAAFLLPFIHSQHTVMALPYHRHLQESHKVQTGIRATKKLLKKSSQNGMYNWYDKRYNSMFTHPPNNMGPALLTNLRSLAWLSGDFGAFPSLGLNTSTQLITQLGSENPLIHRCSCCLSHKLPPHPYTHASLHDVHAITSAGPLLSTSHQKETRWKCWGKLHLQLPPIHWLVNIGLCNVIYDVHVVNILQIMYMELGVV